MPLDSLSGNPSAFSTMFGRKKKVITTYSKNRPVQITLNNHFPTPDTPGYSSKEKSSQQDIKKKGPKSWVTPLGGRGSGLALRNISNIPLEKTLSRTPCVQSQRSIQTNRRLISSGILPTKVSASDGKECKPYRSALQRARLTKSASAKKTNMLVSTTTYSPKSMSCCSVCGSATCSNEHFLSTIKSMSLCKSSLDESASGDLEDDVRLTNESQVSQPHNSTLIEEGLNVELKDIIPQDLSAILEEPVDEEGQAQPAKKSKIGADINELHEQEPNISPILASKANAPVEVKSLTNKTVCQDAVIEEEGVPDTTPETVPKKECTATDEPKQKRKLAYSFNVDHLPDCILLDVKNSKKRPSELLFKRKINSYYCKNPCSDLPDNILDQ